MNLHKRARQVLIHVNLEVHHKVWYDFKLLPLSPQLDMEVFLPTHELPEPVLQLQSVTLHLSDSLGCLLCFTLPKGHTLFFLDFLSSH